MTYLLGLLKTKHLKTWFIFTSAIRRRWQEIEVLQALRHPFCCFPSLPLSMLGKLFVWLIGKINMHESCLFFSIKLGFLCRKFQDYLSSMCFITIVYNLGFVFTYCLNIVMWKKNVINSQNISRQISITKSTMYMMYMYMCWVQKRLNVRNFLSLASRVGGGKLWACHLFL